MTYYAVKGKKACGVVVEVLDPLIRVLVRQPATDEVAALQTCYTPVEIRRRLIRYNRSKGTRA